MKGLFLAAWLACTFSTCVVAETKLQRGTIVRMQMAECISQERGFMAALSGASHPSTEEYCPEYVLVADKVVYVIVGRTSSSLVPLAETTKFRFQNNELLIRIDDARHETRFGIREMVLRSEWDRVHPRTMDGLEDQSPHRVEAAVAMQQPQ
jgi:hypothetical protein